jgi:hypothetical protein
MGNRLKKNVPVLMFSQFDGLYDEFGIKVAL